MWSTIICMMCNGENFQISPRLPKRKKQMREITRFISMFHVSCAFPRGRERVSSLWVFDVFRVLYDVF